MFKYITNTNIKSSIRHLKFSSYSKYSKNVKNNNLFKLHKECVDKEFNSIDKMITQHQKHVETQLNTFKESVDKQLSFQVLMLMSGFSMMGYYITDTKKDIDKKFENIDKKFENIDKKFEELAELINRKNKWF